jgi:hypothetical protein
MLFQTQSPGAASPSGGVRLGQAVRRVLQEVQGAEVKDRLLYEISIHKMDDARLQWKKLARERRGEGMSHRLLSPLR